MNIFRMLQQRMGLIAVLAVLGLVAGGLFTLRMLPAYAASVDVMVVKKKGAMASDFRTAMLDDYVAIQVTIIKSDRVLREAAQLLQQGEIAGGVAQATDTAGAPKTDAPTGTVSATVNRFQGKEIQDLIDYLRAGIGIIKAKEAGSTTASNNVLKVSFQSGSSTECVQALKAVIKGYKNYLDKEYNLADDQFMTRLERSSTVARREAQQLREDLRLIE